MRESSGPFRVTGRLNVIRMLSDTDYADSASGSTFRASEAGQALLAQRRVAT